MHPQLAVQLFTLRDACKRDFPAVLRELSKRRWAGVQIGGLFGYDPAEIAAVLEETGLRTAGLHAGYQQITGDLDAVVKLAELFRTRDIICPFIPPANRSAEDYRRIKQGLNEAAARVRDKGFRISYHNHAFEFETMVDGRNALDYLLEPAADNAILAEIDVYWIQKAGLDPVSYIRAFANRMPIIHLKDMTADERQIYAEVGTGVIPFEPILQWGGMNGIEWYVVEQDECFGDPMDCLQTSYDNLTKMIASLPAMR